MLMMAAGCSEPTQPMEPSVGSATSPLASDLTWVGDTHLRYDGRFIPPGVVMSGRSLEVYSQTWPSGLARKVELWWRTPEGSVRTAAMSIDVEGAGRFGNNTQWRATIPGADLAGGAQTEYWIRAEGAGGRVLWDSDDGKNHRLDPTDETVLWDGGAADLFQHVGRGAFVVEGGALVAKPGDGLGLLWCKVPLPTDFELSLEYRLSSTSDNSGVFVRFREPETFGYDNAAWAAVHDGLEVQIDELARPDGAATHRTGAFYEVTGQALSPTPSRSPGEWNAYVIRSIGEELTVHLNGQRVSTLAWAGDPARALRGAPSREGAPRFFGVQAHTGAVAFRNLRLRRL